MAKKLKINQFAVGPEMAAQLLGNNTQNRKISTRIVKRYARDMANDDWHSLADPIRIARNGVILDGQHRLKAIIESGTEQCFVIAEGLEIDDQLYMDQGRKRSAADQLKIDGVTNCTFVAAIAKIRIMWDRDQLAWLSRADYTPTVSHIVEYVRDNAETLSWVGSQLNQKNGLRMHIAAVGAVLSEAYEIDRDDANAFIDSLIVGANLGPESPILAYRNFRLRVTGLGQFVTQLDDMHFLIKTWNSWRKNSPVTILRIPKIVNNTNLPKMV